MQRGLLLADSMLKIAFRIGLVRFLTMSSLRACRPRILSNGITIETVEYTPK